MQEKVKVTQKQADWLEEYKLTQENIDYILDVHWYRKRPDSPLIGWSISKLARALYIGYEVEQKYKKGDWIISVDGSNLNGYWQSHIEKVDDVEGEYVRYNGNCNSVHKNEVRLATPSEIAEEKERRFWKKHGREVWELKRGDVISHGGDLLIIDEVYTDDYYAFEASNYHGSMKLPKQHLNKCKIVCFIEDRKDK